VVKLGCGMRNSMDDAIAGTAHPWRHGTPMITAATAKK